MSHGHRETPSDSSASPPPASGVPVELATVIYTRTNNAETSPLDKQEQMLRSVLSEHGIDTTVTVVIRDVGPGRCGEGTGRQHLERMLTAGEVGVLAVTDLGRLGRAGVTLKLMEKALEQGVQVFTEQGPLPAESWRTLVMYTTFIDEMMATTRMRSIRRHKARFAE